MTSSPSSTLAAEHAGSAPAGATVPGSAPSSRDALLEPVLSQLDVLTIELADDYRIVRVGDACAAISGFATDEVLGRSYLRSFLLPEDIESVRAAFAQLDEGADCRDFECHLLTKDGERRRTRWAFRAVEAEDATARSYVGVCLLQVSETPEAPEALVESASSPEQPNRRRQPRRPYRVEQRIAPVIDGRMPLMSDFRSVLCHDISSGGIAFLELEPPEYDDVVIALDSGGRTMYLRAAVRHTRPKVVDGREVHLVGCQYTGRVDF